MSDSKPTKNLSSDIGYKKPPKHSRFAPGVSGNPKGRPTGSKNKKGESYIKGIEELILAEAYRTIEVNENGERIKIPIAQAALRSLAVKAAKGNIRAGQLMMKQIAEIERKREEARNQFDETLITYKVEWEIERKRRARAGEDMPDLPVDPDNIILDDQADRVRVISREERETRDKLKHLRQTHREEIGLIEQDLKNPENKEFFQQLRENLERSQHFVKRINEVLPE
ncbi:MAG: DUF5681 domain-containing protein [Pseudomonadota bacterium]